MPPKKVKQGDWDDLVQAVFSGVLALALIAASIILVILPEQGYTEVVLGAVLSNIPVVIAYYFRKRT